METGTMRISGRKGLSLVEIMVSLMVLSIGLLGVLAAIPFGGFQLAKMKDADYSSAVAKKAFAAIESNRCDTPSPQYLCNLNTKIARKTPNIANSFFPADDVFYEMIAKENTLNLDLTLPIILDPVGWEHPNFSAADQNRLAYQELYYQPLESNFADLDPTGANANNYTYNYNPYVVSWLDNPASVRDLVYSVIWPNFNFTENGVTLPRSLSPKGVEYFFYNQDDIAYGTPETEKNFNGRPVVQEESVTYPYPLSETKKNDLSNFSPYFNLNNELLYQSNMNRQTFTGEYNWLALLRFIPQTEPFYDCPVDDIYKTEVDVAVCKGGRSSADAPLIYPITLNGTGYQGGSFEIWNRDADGDDVPLNAEEATAMKDALKETTWLMLIGDEDVPQRNDRLGWVYRRFARWYKIASWKVAPVQDEDTGVDLPNQFYVALTLIGPDCPKRWDSSKRVDPETGTVYTGDYEYYKGTWAIGGVQDGAAHHLTIKAVIYPKVMNVFTKTVSLSDR